MPVETVPQITTQQQAVTKRHMQIFEEMLVLVSFCTSALVQQLKLAD